MDIVWQEILPGVEVPLPQCVPCIVENDEISVTHQQFTIWGIWINDDALVEDICIAVTGEPDCRFVEITSPADSDGDGVADGLVVYLDSGVLFLPIGG
jgi:hypothetical protein